MQKPKAQAIIRNLAKNYNLMAADWDLSRFQPSGIKLRLVKDIKKGARVLDVGCGNGLVAPIIIERGAMYTGIDISKKLISIAGKKLKDEVKTGKARFLVGDATKKFPFSSASMDNIICFAVFHHIPTPELRKKVLNEFYRVLKPGGRAGIIVWNLLNPWADSKFKISEQLKNKSPALDAGDVFVPWKATGGKIINRYLHVFTKDELKNIIAGTKFKKIKIGYFNRAGQATVSGEELVVNLTK